MEKEIKSTSHVLVVPVTMAVGDGNPFARHMVSQLVESELQKNHAKQTAPEQNITLFELTPRLSSLIGRLGHTAMNQFSFLTRSYTQNSESLRSGLLMKTLATLSGWELEQQLTRHFRESGLDPAQTQIVLAFTQEHPLMGLSKKFGKRFPHVRSIVYVPDVSPKQSAVGVVQERAHDAAGDPQHSPLVSFAVWNPEAAKQMADQNIPVFQVSGLYEQYLREKYLGEESEAEQRRQQPLRGITVKSSGGGMSRFAAQALEEQLGTDAGTSYHYPQRILLGGRGTYAYEGKERQPGARLRFVAFLRCALHSRIIVSPPNENVGLVEALNKLGLPVRMVALPPHGEHEQKNFVYGTEKGLILGVLGEGKTTAEAVRELAYGADWQYEAVGYSQEQIGLSGEGPAAAELKPTTDAPAILTLFELIFRSLES